MTADKIPNGMLNNTERTLVKKASFTVLGKRAMILVKNWFPRPVGNSKVSCKNTGNPVKISGEKGLIQPSSSSSSATASSVALSPRQQAGRVAWSKVHNCKDNQRDTQTNRNQPQEPLANEL